MTGFEYYHIPEYYRTNNAVVAERGPSARNLIVRGFDFDKLVILAKDRLGNAVTIPFQEMGRYVPQFERDGTQRTGCVITDRLMLELELPVRAMNVLSNNGWDALTVAQFVENVSVGKLAKARNCGALTVRQIREALAKIGVSMREE